MIDLNTLLANFRITARKKAADLLKEENNERQKYKFPLVEPEDAQADYGGSFREGSRHPGAIARGTTAELMRAKNDQMVTRAIEQLAFERTTWEEIARWAGQGLLYMPADAQFSLYLMQEFKAVYGAAAKAGRIEREQPKPEVPYLGDRYRAVAEKWLTDHSGRA